MKYLIIIPALLNGLFMLADGIHVMVKGKYMGPPKPGPWAYLFEKIGIDAFKMGPVFICFGIVWLSFLAGFIYRLPWAFNAGMILAACTLWYLPAGTLLSLLVMFGLIYLNNKSLI